jgi:hypothetical protein
VNESKTAIDADWEAYADVFPDRYLQHSGFDDLVEAEIARRATTEARHTDVAKVDALDIGGGKTGTHYLRQPHLRCWLHDPFIKQCPEWMVANLDWNAAEGMQFDVILARDCFNYLTRSQIKGVPSMLKQGGIFMFNTFYKPRTNEKRYVNSRSGATGTERYTYHQDKGLIEYELAPDNWESVVRSTFFAYLLDDIVELLGTDRLGFLFFAPNMLSVSLQRQVATH